MECWVAVTTEEYAKQLLRDKPLTMDGRYGPQTQDYLSDTAARIWTAVKDLLRPSQGMLYGCCPYAMAFQVFRLLSLTWALDLSGHRTAGILYNVLWTTTAAYGREIATKSHALGWQNVDNLHGRHECVCTVQELSRSLCTCMHSGGAAPLT